MSNQDKVYKLVTKYKKLLKLDHWNVVIKLRPVNPDNSEVAAQITVQTDYLWAVLTVYDLAFEKSKESSPMDLDHIIKHELCHIITQPLVDSCYNLINGKLVTPREIEHQREVMTESIARVIK